MGIGAVLIGKDEGTDGTQVKIVRVEVSHIPRGEIVRDRAIGRKLQHAVAVCLATVWDIKAVGAGFPGFGEDVTACVGRGTVACLPKGSQSRIGGWVQDVELR